MITSEGKAWKEMGEAYGKKDAAWAEYKQQWNAYCSGRGSLASAEKALASFDALARKARASKDAHAAASIAWRFP